MWSALCCFIRNFQHVIYLFIYFSIAGRKEKILFSTAYKIKEIDLDTGDVKDLANHRRIVYSLADDVKGRYVYVPRYHEHVIERYVY